MEDARMTPGVIGVLSQSFNSWQPCPGRMNTAFVSGYNTNEIVKFG